MAKKYLVINKATDKILMIADDEDSAYTFIKLCNLNFEDFSIEKVEMRYFGRSIIISIRPEWVYKILNGEKTLEIRKLFPKDYVGWIFIYCTKNGKLLMAQRGNFKGFELINTKDYGDYVYTNICECLNGKVVAKFWCDKVEEIKYHPYDCTFYTDTVDTVISADNPVSSFEKASGLSYYDLSDYLYNGKDKVGYAIHISRLEILDKPMVLTMFRKVGFRKFLNDNKPNRMSLLETLKKYSITKAPQSWQYIED